MRHPYETLKKRTVSNAEETNACDNLGCLRKVCAESALNLDQPQKSDSPKFLWRPGALRRERLSQKALPLVLLNQPKLSLLCPDG